MLFRSEAYVAFGKAMATSGLGSAASGFGNLVGNIADGISKMFGNKDAIQKFVDFTKLDIDTNKAEKLSEAFYKYTQAMGTLGGTVGVKPAGRANVPSTTGGGAEPATGATSSGGTASAPGIRGAVVTGKTASGGTSDRKSTRLNSSH